MAQILTIIRHDLRIFLTNRSNLPNLLLVPAVMTVIIGLINGGAFGGVAVRRLDVIDQDNSPASSQFLASVRRANPGLTLCPMENNSQDVCALGASNKLSQSQALDRVANSTSLGLLVIPSGFGADLASQKPTSLSFYSTNSLGTPQSAQEAIQSALSQVNAASVSAQVGLSVISSLQGQPLAGEAAQQLQGAIYQRALQLEENPTVSTDFSLSQAAPQQSVSESLQQGLGQSVPGMGTMFVLMTVFGGMAALIVERQEWTLPRLAMMPIARSTLLAGKILARFCLGLVQFLVVFIVGGVLGMNFGKDPLALILLVILYTLTITALTFAIGSGLKTPSQASGLGLLLTLTLAPIGGAWWPMDISPKFMQIIGHVSPVAWAMDGFTALTYNGAHLVDILLPIGVLLGMTIVFFLIAIPRFKFQVG
jgi:ABC-2 type transport system permease protein